MSRTIRLDLPLLEQGQSMKHITHNEALAIIDGLLHLSALSIANTPPDVPSEDAIYIVGDAPGGAFASQAARIAVFQNGGFLFLAPRIGWRCYVQDVGDLLVYDGSRWKEVSSSGVAENLPRLGINTEPDSLNRLSVSSNHALFSATTLTQGGTGDIRVKLNKESAGQFSSLIFQSGWAGRAELGLIGDDNFRIKISATGLDWQDALIIDRISAIAQAPMGLSTSRLSIAQSFDPGNGIGEGGQALTFSRSRGTQGNRAAVAAGDLIGQISAQAFDGQKTFPAGFINFEVDGNSSLIGAGRITFGTMSAGSAIVRERLRLDGTGTLRSATDNSASLGSPFFRWSTVYCATGIITTSDLREKVDVETLHCGLALVRRLRPVSYRWRVGESQVADDGSLIERRGERRHAGLLAQEVKAAMDECGTNFGAYVFDPETDRHGLRYDQLIAPIIRALQELDTRLETLSQRLQAPSI